MLGVSLNWTLAANRIGLRRDSTSQVVAGPGLMKQKSEAWISSFMLVMKPKGRMQVAPLQPPYSTSSCRSRPSFYPEPPRTFSARSSRTRRSSMRVREAEPMPSEPRVISRVLRSGSRPREQSVFFRLCRIWKKLPRTG